MAAQSARSSMKTLMHAKHVLTLQEKCSSGFFQRHHDQRILSCYGDQQPPSGYCSILLRGTEDYEGFYHLVSMSGDCSKAQLNYIVRDHDKNFFEARKRTLTLIEKNLNAKWGEGTVKIHHRPV